MTAGDVIRSGVTASWVFEQQDGEVTKAYYAAMNERGIPGQLAVALFRAQKRSTAAKRYRNKFSRDAYDVKNWSLSEVCRICSLAPSLFEWGWKEDPKTRGFKWVLYVVLPQGQVSFHSASRLNGPDFAGEWDGQHLSKERILAFCDSIGDHPIENVNIQPREQTPPSNPWDRMRQQIGEQKQ